MWRINNFLLAIFLAGAILVGGLTFYDNDLQWWLDDWFGDSTQQQRELDAEAAVDQDGQPLRTHAVSYSQPIEADEWNPWSAILIQQASMETPVGISQESDQIIVTGTRRGVLPKMAAPSSQPSVYVRFANNVVLRNSHTGEERILFDQKAAITRLLPIIHETAPGLAALYADADTNGDGKINGDDRIKLRYFKFDGGVLDIPFEGIAPSFLTYQSDEPAFRMTARRDLNSDGKVQENLEPAVLYDIDVATGDIRTALTAETTDRLQAILDAR